MSTNSRQGRRYRFTVTFDGTDTVMDPDYGGSITDAREEGYVFYRKAWNGQLDFFRDEYQLIVDADFETRYEIVVALQDKDGYYNDIFIGYFTKTDLEVDEDRRRVTVKPLPLDAYTEIIDNKEKEVDLIEEDCPITSLGIERKVAVQIYFRGTTGSEAAHQEIMTIIGDNAFQSMVTDPLVTSQQLQNDYYFAELPTMGYIPPVPGLTPDVSGYYDIQTLPTGGLGFRRLDGAYWLTNSLGYYPGATGGTPPPSGGIGITDAGTGDYVYETNGDVELFPADATYNERSPEYTSLSDPDSKCRFYWIAPFARVLLNEDTFDGSATEDIPETDIIEEQLNYRKCAPFDSAVITMKSQTRVDKSSLGKVPSWAKMGAGEYHYQLTPTPVLTEVPLFFDNWTAVSVWWQRDNAAQQLINGASEQIQIDHAFRLRDVVLTVAQALGSSVTDMESDFFYGANPFRAGIEPFVVPRSNVAIANYNAPATKAPIKWTDIDTLLSIYNAKWVIEGTTIRIEHRDYFDNGGDYTTLMVGVDITTLTAPKTNQKWEYGQNVYRYDKPNIPAEIQWDWQEDVGLFFEGEPMECISAYVDAGQIEERALAPFITDLDRVMIQGGSLEGFVLLEAFPVLGQYNVVSIEINTDGWVGLIQNGSLSLYHLVPTYHKHGAPCEKIVINGNETTAESIIRSRIQDITIPDIVVDALKLFRTGIGDGKMRTREIDNKTGQNEITIEHDIE